MTRTQLLWKGSFWALVMATLWLSLVPVHHVPSAFSFWDKAQHALGFAGLAFLGLMAYPGRNVRVLFSLLLLGAGIEVVQGLTGWRQGDWQDWVADCAGLIMGSACWRGVATFTHQPS